ncbi:uncharacterized protein PHACADRAFT_200651 [Phanerochaete carnosa HHB-10118-sp]|uniref:Uncharacterized protein n=1 Tax=Phanerochaete carnosa (strain HHB-10118-sp) TaxID=650164 RepID=K5WKB8_PHACS|nr:uncharacterized protein PHACADRAFT_200651 [Phanerochaete carnosa HHB-10118-sp]EKM50712.1 hypothetical protein PHACADRAFT_200651 [Phanerochaete carnosa HHB-10118-sp]
MSKITRTFLATLDPNRRARVSSVNAANEPTPAEFLGISSSDPADHWLYSLRPPLVPGVPNEPESAFNMSRYRNNYTTSLAIVAKLGKTPFESYVRLKATALMDVLKEIRPYVFETLVYLTRESAQRQPRSLGALVEYVAEKALC